MWSERGLESVHFIGIRSESSEHAISGGIADGDLAIGIVKHHALLGQTLKVGGYHMVSPVNGKLWSKIIKLSVFSKRERGAERDIERDKERDIERERECVCVFA
jgi:hypothetical protein